jgi:uroporphyrin-III C-methyltransferase/precorrin-2 dehydrogenase/sirohydrochlorin ferrochelatase
MDVLPSPPSEAPARIAPLAKLPVFWALEGRRVVVAGGSDAAAWKAELLSACGAAVDLYAERPEATCLALLGRRPVHPAARLTHHRRQWTAADLTGAALAIADCDDEIEACAFVSAARAAGVPVNVIDKPEHCQFQFGSIVNRSPVVVAISTDGAAPILAQTIRRKIETMLPRGLTSWAALAQSLRERVNARLAAGAARRIFWERFTDLAFSSNDTPEEGVGRALLADAERLAGAPASGRVTVVGAGPGDPELLTLKAVRALQSADVILFDDLVSNEVLELARREAKRLLVNGSDGHAGGDRDSAHATMAKLARSGKRVVRLVSGDPLSTGRASETIARLQDGGIPVELIPGVAAAAVVRDGDQPHLGVETTPGAPVEIRRAS